MNDRQALAITGYALRFPGGADSPEQLWSLLMEGRDAIVPLPPSRLPLRYRSPHPDVLGRSASIQAGVLTDIEGFDAEYFGIAPREARLMDPHQRLLLELTIEALERSGTLVAQLAGRKVAVFAALPGAQYLAQLGDYEMDVQAAVGNDPSIAANRISYVLNLTGPSVSLNTACSSALTGFHLGCQAIRSGDAEMAIVGAANLLIDPQFHLLLSHAKLLSPDARCRSFDATGRGYVRAEGAAVMVIKKLDRALADRDPIRAVVLASAVNTAGRTAGISLPSGAAQARLLTDAYDAAGIDPAEVFYVEAHGTGTAAGDPIECGALGQVLGAGHSGERPLLIGSIKSNIGHMETAAGFGGLAKALLCLEHGMLPPSLHFDTPNPAIDFAGHHLRVVTQPTAIPPDDRGIVGVSAFGFGGSNAHVVLSRHVQSGCRTKQPDVLALPITARSAAALKAAIAGMAAFLAQAGGDDTADIVYTALRRRDPHRHRAVAVADDAAGLRAALETLAADGGGSGESWACHEGIAGKSGKTAFVFTGNGPQWHAMGRELLQDAPAFKQRFAEVEAAFSETAGFSLREELMRDEKSSRIGRTDVAQPLLFTLQLALVAELGQLGIVPDAVLGHSVGEVAAACVAGALTLAQAVRVIHQRSRWQQTTQGAGQMAAVGLSAQDAEAWLATHAPKVVVAAANGPRSATLAGDAAFLAALDDIAGAAGIFFRRLRLDYAFHSPAMDPIRDGLLNDLRAIGPAAGCMPFVSSVTGGVLGGEHLDGAYWWRNVRDRVQFQAGVESLIATGHDLFIEIGPHPALAGYVSETLTELGRSAQVFETLRRREPERPALHRLLARCLATGDHVDRTMLSPAGKVVDLPAYPWQHETYWAAGQLAEGDEQHPLLGTRLRAGLPYWEILISQRSHPFLADHRYAGEPIMATSGYIEMARAAGEALYGSYQQDIYDLEIHQMMQVPAERPIRVCVAVQADGGFAVSSRPADGPGLPWIRHASGRIVAVEAGPESWLRLSAADAPPEDAVYGDSDIGGLAYGPSFRLIERLYSARGGEAEWTVGDLSHTAMANLAPGYCFHPALLDSALQLPWFKFLHDNDTHFLPAIIHHIRIIHSGATAARVAMRVVSFTPHLLQAEMQVLEADGRVLAVIAGYQARRVASARTATRLGLLHHYRWELHPPARDLPWVEPADLLRAAAPPVEGGWNEQLGPVLDDFCGAVAAAALRGLAPVANGWPDLKALSDAGEIDEALLPFAERLQAMAVGDSGGETAFRRAAAEAPALFLEFELAWTIGRKLPDVLRGVLDAQDMLPAARADGLLPRTAENGLLDAAARHAAAAAVRDLLDRWAGERRLRVLELGAARGALTAALLEAIPAERADYVLTDPDGDLLEQLNIRFERPGFSTAIADPLLAADLGQLAGHYDLIISNDTLQQSEDVAATLARWRRLLSPNGLLLLHLRGIIRFSDLVFGAQRSMNWIEDGLWPGLLEQAGFAAPAVRALPSHLGRILIAGNAEPRKGLVSKDAARDRRAFLITVPASRQAVADRLVGELDAGGNAAAWVADRSDGTPVDWPAHLGSVEEVVFLAPRGIDGEAPALGGSLPRLAQAMRAAEPSPRLTLVTFNGFDISGSAASLDPTQSLFWGFGRSLGNELPGLRCRRIDLHDAAIDRLAGFLMEAATEEDEIRLSAHACHVHRLAFLPLPSDALPPATGPIDYALGLSAAGSAQNLVWHRVVPQPPAAGQIQLRVASSALNFKDVLLVNGVLPSDLLKTGPAGIAVGLECAGTVTAIGPAVGGFAPGDRVAAIAVGSFASSVTVAANCAVRIPDCLSFADAATMPMAFATAWYALHHLARLRAGEVVLIHGGAGGVGLAAIQIAHHLGATVIATAGSEEKRDILRRIGVAQVLNSRDLAFARRARELTGGTGVDVALNALSGEAMLATIGTLRPFGRFLEIGKRDLIENRQVGLRGFIDNLSYHAIDLDQVITYRPEMLSGVLSEIMQLAQTAALRPLPREVYSPAQVIECFRRMQASRHVGKLLVNHNQPPPPASPVPPKAGALRFDNGGTILVTGGTRGFGLALARWLATRGAPCLVLLGRTGTVDVAGQDILRAMRRDGARVEILAADCGSAKEMDHVFAEMAVMGLPPLTGLFHAAVSYADRIVLSVTEADLDQVIGPKARGAWLLDRMTRGMKLRHFVLFSSIAATVGSEGQAAYAAANLYLEALVASRRAEGLAGLAVNWGAIGGAGQVERDEALRERMQTVNGLELLTVTDAMAALEAAMLLEVGQIGVGHLPRHAIRSWHAARPTGRLDPILSVLRQQDGDGQVASLGDDTDWAAAATPEERLAGFKALVLAIIRETLGYGTRPIDSTLTVGDLGADSLIALQLVHTLERRLRLTFPDFRQLQARSIDDVVILLFERASRDV